MATTASHKPRRRSFHLQTNRHARGKSYRPRVERLEGRHLLATIIVTGTGDTIAVDGLVTLREAITSANNNANVNADVVAVGAYGQDTINFNISGAGPHTISPTAVLPTITDPLLIDGYSQPGAQMNTLASGNNAILLIELNGTSAGAGAAGLAIGGGNGSTIQGLVINRFGIGIQIGGTSSVTVVQGNFIGTDVGGTVDLGNSVRGVEIADVTANTIGGTTPAARNVISGNQLGVLIQGPEATNNFVQGNFIGTDKTGTLDLGNSASGVTLSNAASFNRIGGTLPGAGNVISGNGLDGVEMIDDATHNNIVEANLIGTNALGTAAIPNGGRGVRISNASSNTIGGVAFTAGNVIANNQLGGVLITGGTATGNVILVNSIFSNTGFGGNPGLGIDLGDNGVTPNDAGDPDEGPNNLQNFPVLTSVTQENAGADTRCQGTINSLPNTAFRIDCFANVAGDPSGFGEGQNIIGFIVVATDSNGNASFNILENTQPGNVFTATATRLDSQNQPVETSEFSAVFSTQAPSADLSLAKMDSPDPVAAGANLTYTIIVSNVGPSDAQGVSLSDAIPPNTTFVSFTAPAGFTPTTPAVGGTGTVTATGGTIAAGGNASFTLVVKVNPGVTAGSTITNTATATASTPDPTPGANTITQTTAVITSADLSVTKTDTPDPIAAGANLTYTINVRNIGPSIAQNVSLSDVVPAGTTFVSFTAPAGFTATTPPAGGTGTITATSSTLAAGTTATFTLVVQVDPAAVDGTVISNTAAVTTIEGTPDPNPANNSDTETTTVGQEEPPGLPVCEVLTFNEPGSPGSATLSDDADNPGDGVLIVTGTSGNDVIVIEPRPSNSSQIRVKRDGQLVAIFRRSAVQHIVVFGLAGNDLIVVNAALTQRATLFGNDGKDQLFGGRGADGLEGGNGNDRLFGGGGNDVVCGAGGNDSMYGQSGNDLLGGDAGDDRIWGEAGHDQLLGGTGNDSLYGGNGNDLVFGQSGNDLLHGDNGNDVLVGGAGADRLIGGLGRDVLIGGNGADELIGEGDDDILVGGSTSYDEDTQALRAILAEWSSTRTYSARANNIRSGGGATGGFALDDSSVLDDGLVDLLLGGGGLDWFFAGASDRLKGRSRNERVN